MILSTTFNFLSNWTVGCISWQRNRKENFVNGDQMSKWRLFVDWWAERQRGKNAKQAKAKIISKAPGGFSLCQTWSFPRRVDPSLFQPPLKLNKSCILLMALRCNEFWLLKVWNAKMWRGKSSYSCLLHNRFQDRWFSWITKRQSRVFTRAFRHAFYKIRPFFSVYVLFSHFRPRDDTPENCFSKVTQGVILNYSLTKIPTNVS